MSRWHIHRFRYDGFDPFRGSILICRCGEVRYSGRPEEELREASRALGDAMRQVEAAAAQVEAAHVHVDCWCGTCEGIVLTAREMNGDRTAIFDREFIVCDRCGNKRCPRAWHHDNDCTGSNEPGQTATRNGVTL